jgi:hypothetical protein
MLKSMLSALVVSGVMLSGAAFAADQTPGGQTPAQVQTPATTAEAPKTTTPAKHHKAHKAKVTKTTTEPAAKTAEPSPKTN